MQRMTTKQGDQYVKNEHIDDKHWSLEYLARRLGALEDQIDSGELVEGAIAKWIPTSNKPGVQVGMKCSECKARIRYREYYHGTHKYCHSCGAKMAIDRQPGRAEEGGGEQ